MNYRVSVIPLDREFLGISNGNKFENVNYFFVDFLDDNPGQKYDYLELAKSEEDVFCISQSYVVIQNFQIHGLKNTDDLFF
jgi:hypothetical protein